MEIEEEPIKDISWAIKIISRASKLQHLRLRRGLQRRARIAEALGNGEDPGGYRVEWLKNTASAVLEVIDIAKDKFNDEHIDDLVSRSDVVDVLTTAIGWVTQKR